MFVLVEPISIDMLLTHPDLGCAMVIAACSERGIRTTLIRGQTRFLKDIFVTDAEENWHLICGLNKYQAKKIGIAGYKKSIQEKGLKYFQEELWMLYQSAIVDKDIRNYLNSKNIENFLKLYLNFIAVYSYYLVKLQYGKLKIIDHYVTEIIKNNPQYIGFSIHNYIDPLTQHIIKRTKELTGKPIIIGGSFTPFIDPKHIDREFTKGQFDYLVIGPGEHSAPSLIEAIRNNKEPKGIANVFYKKSNKVKGNKLEIISNLNNLPYPDYSQFGLDLYLTPKRILPLQTARGCSWRKCAFCSHYNIYQRAYKTIDAERVVEILKYLQIKYDCHHFILHDEELPPGRARRLSKALLTNKTKNMFFYTYARLVKGYNDSSLLRLMRMAGFSLIHWGMESACQRILNSMNKGTQLETTSQILKKSSKNKIANLCFIIFGFPGETEEDAQQTIKFLKRHADYIEEITVSPFHLDYFSPIWKNPRKWGIEIKKDGSYLTSKGMNANDANIFCEQFIKRYEMNSIKVTADGLRYLPSSKNRRVLRFLLSSHNLLPRKTLAKYINEERLDNIFPVVLGRLEKENGRIRFYSIDIKETTFINRFSRSKNRILNRFEEKLFNLSNGRLSIEEIISVMSRDCKAGCQEVGIRKRAREFFGEIFSKDQGVGFVKSWK